MLGMNFEPAVFRVDDVHSYAWLDVAHLIRQLARRGKDAAGLGDFVGAGDRLLDFRNFYRFCRLSFFLHCWRCYFLGGGSYRRSWRLTAGGLS